MRQRDKFVMIDWEAERNKAIKSRKLRNKKIIERVRDICQKQGGMSEIGEGFVVVDTRKFNVIEKGEK